MKCKIFINYRRDDASAEALLVRGALIEKFGVAQVFMDIVAIGAGSEWPAEIQQKLKSANVVVTVMGPEWLTAGIDEFGKRRIDRPSDWVRKELEAALSSGQKLIPVFVRGAQSPPASALPRKMRRLSKIQGIPIRRDYWLHDIQLLLANLAPPVSRSQAKRFGGSPYPASDLLPPERIAQARLQTILAKELPLWELISSERPHEPGVMREEIYRELKFKRFAEVISFMEQVASGCDVANHHPRWENIFKTLYVYLSTWDSNFHAVSDRDVQLARYFDKAYAEFPGALPDPVVKKTPA